MKERSPFCLSILLTILLAVLLSGCAGTNGQIESDPTAEDINSQEIQEDKHSRVEDYMAAFNRHKLSAGSFTLHMENRIYEETAVKM